jgi:hypothetical protein
LPLTRSITAKTCAAGGRREAAPAGKPEDVEQVERLPLDRVEQGVGGSIGSSGRP